MRNKQNLRKKKLFWKTLLPIHMKIIINIDSKAFKFGENEIMILKPYEF